MRTPASGTPAHTQESPRFTPSPWRCIGQRLIVTTAGAGLPICNVLPGGVGIEQADANERQIAAAPELYTATALAAIVADCVAVTAIGDLQVIPGRFIEQARQVLKIAQEGRK